jgi:diguanylate cyclase (GGDEF)-like protein
MSVGKKPKYSVPVSLLAIKQQLINRLLYGTFIIALIGAPASVLRYLSTGWLTLYTIHLIVAVIVVFLFMLRKKISYKLKSIFLIFLFASVGILGLYNLGILGAGFWWIIVTCFLTSTLYSLRAGIISVFLATVVVVIAGYCYSNEIISLPFDANTYIKSTSSWVSLLIATTVMPFIVFQALASYQYATIGLLKEVERQNLLIQKMATHDQLTGLLLLNQANEKLALAIEKANKSGKKVALLFVDLDGFKMVNDNYGHDAGDYVLEKVAKRMLKQINKRDTACRIGGDEFILIFPEVTDVEQIKQTAQNIVDDIARPFNYLGLSIYIGSSIGISLYDDHANNPKLLRILADKAMYSVKESGKNGFAFVEDIQ